MICYDNQCNQASHEARKVASCHPGLFALMNSLLYLARLQQQALDEGAVGWDYREQECYSSDDESFADRDDCECSVTDECGDYGDYGGQGTQFQRDLRVETSFLSQQPSDGNTLRPSSPSHPRHNTSNTSDSSSQPNINNISDPPTPWRTSTAKKIIINELQNESSEIHMYIGHYTPTDWKAVNFKAIREKFASTKYPMKRFTPNMKTLLKNHLNKTGDFAKKELAVEKWYTRVNNVSTGYKLLWYLYTWTQRTKTKSII